MDHDMKGLILAAGRGTRLRPLTHTRPKHLFRIAGRPIMHYALENLREAGVCEVGIVVSPYNKEDFQQALSDFPGMKLEYIVQEEALGLAHAVGVTRDWLAGSPFVLYLGDNLFQHGIKPFVEAYQPGVSAVIALVQVEDPRQFGVALVEDGRIVKLLEKPKDPPSNLAVAGVYVFGPEIMEIIADLKPSARGEYEITDAIQGLIDGGKTVLGQEIEGWWKDTGRPTDLLDANRLLLVEQKSPTPVLEGDIQDSQITGRVVVEAGAQVYNSTILGPAHIASGAKLEGAYIGPFTSVGPGATVRQSEVEFSILEEGAVVEQVPIRLHECILGVGAKVMCRTSLPKAHKLVLGDLSSAELA
jgi:glucose-1-phosphate thymidylyltransferase